MPATHTGYISDTGANPKFFFRPGVTCTRVFSEQSRIVHQVVMNLL